MADNVSENAKGQGQEEKRRGLGKACRIIGWAVGGTVAVLILLLAVVFLIRDVIVVETVTRVGTYLTGTEVTVDSFRSTVNGTIELTGLKVANPPGYRNEHAFTLDRIYLSLVPGTLLDDRIEINEIAVSGMRVAYEPVLNGSNLQDIQDHLAAVTGGDEGTAEKTADTKAPEGGEEAGKQVVIRLLTVNDYAVTLASAAIKTSFSVPLPPVRMTDVGEGRPFADTMVLLYEEMLKSVFSVLNSAGGAVASAVGSAARAAGSGVSDVSNVVGNAARAAGSGVSDVSNAVGDAVGNAARAAGSGAVKSFKGVFDGLVGGAKDKK